MLGARADSGPALPIPSSLSIIKAGMVLVSGMKMGADMAVFAGEGCKRSESATSAWWWVQPPKKTVIPTDPASSEHDKQGGQFMPDVSDK